MLRPQPDRLLQGNEREADNGGEDEGLDQAFRHPAFGVPAMRNGALSGGVGAKEAEQPIQRVHDDRADGYAADQFGRAEMADDGRIHGAEERLRDGRYDERDGDLEIVGVAESVGTGLGGGHERFEVTHGLHELPAVLFDGNEPENVVKNFHDPVFVGRASVARVSKRRRRCRVTSRDDRPPQRLLSSNVQSVFACAGGFRCTACV